MYKDQVLQEFSRLCKIPRPSGHEQAVAAHIAARARELGYAPRIDGLNNVIVEVPATPGREQSPLTILQAHTDMVCVAAADVKNYRPQTAPVKAVISANRMQAVGTSLGADNGVGVAMILALLGSDVPHGPLRALFTADEECGMSGAMGLDAAALAGDYLINCDWEDMGSVCIGCAGGVSLEFERPVAWQSPPPAAAAYVVELSGLRGGHSGVEIGEDRANALKELGGFLAGLAENDVPFYLAELHGGRALNVIPGHARAVVTVAAEDKDALVCCFEETRRYLSEKFGAKEPGLRITCRPALLPLSVASAEDSRSVALLLSVFPQGVETMSELAPGLVESSDNIGSFALTHDSTATMGVMARSSDQERLDSFASTYGALAAAYGFSARQLGSNPCWQPAADSKLAAMARNCWDSRHAQPLEVVLLHAGLECGCFGPKNPGLDMIALGPTIKDVHSVKETLYTDSIAPVMELVAALLDAVCAEG